MALSQDEVEGLLRIERQGHALVAAQERFAALEAERTVLADALRVTYQAHQDIHPCTLCAQMWDKLAKMAALKSADPSGEAT